MAPPPSAPEVPVSWGELIDKITILEIKARRIERPQARANVEHELAFLRARAAPVLFDPGVRLAKEALAAVNTLLWDVEDRLRVKEAMQDFGADFIALARSVYQTNDRRAALKRDINARLDSALVEEKSYADYAPAITPTAVERGAA